MSTLAHHQRAGVESLGCEAAVVTDAAGAPPRLSDVYVEHKEFVWCALQRLGATASDIEDIFQEVFLAVHRRLHTFRVGSPMRPWLFGFCIRLVANHRRRAHRRHEHPVGDAIDQSPTRARDPERMTAERQARARLQAILARMKLDQRAVFVMFEIEGLSCVEIATLIGVPVGTVYSRLDTARKVFRDALNRAGDRAVRVSP